MTKRNPNMKITPVVMKLSHCDPDKLFPGGATLPLPKQTRPLSSPLCLIINARIWSWNKVFKLWDLMKKSVYSYWEHNFLMEAHPFWQLSWMKMVDYVMTIWLIITSNKWQFDLIDQSKTWHSQTHLFTIWFYWKIGLRFPTTLMWYAH